MNRPLCPVCLVFAIAVAFNLYLVPPKEFCTENFDGQRIVLHGRVDHIEYKDDRQLLYLNHINCDSSQTELLSELQTEPASEYQTLLASELHKFPEVSCICYMADEVNVRIGSDIKVSGVCRSFAAASNPGEFDYREYRALQGIYFSMQETQLLTMGTEYSVLRDALYRIRHRGCEILERTLSMEDAGILRAMLLGDKTELATEDQTLFKKSGISHILAISGLHISLIGMGLYRLLRGIRIPHGIGMGLCILLMILYGMMTGMSSSAGRAILMFAINLNAKRVGRTYDMLTALSVAAVCLLIEQPRYVLHAGFQLSFGAVIGLACVEPAFEQLFGRGKKGFCGRMLRSFYAGASINLVTLPILMYHYYEYSLYSIWFNLLVLPTVGIVVGNGFLLLLVADIAKMFARIPATICRLVLEGYRWGGAMLIRIPGAVWITGRPDTYQIVLYGVGILVFVLIAHRNKRNRMIGLLCPVLAILVLSIRWNCGLCITILDVGQGDGICIEVQSGHAVLIDAGSVDQSKLTQYRLEPFLKSKGIHTVDAVFLSHLDKDHISGVLGLLEDTESGIGIKRLIMSAGVPKDEAWQSVLQAVTETETKIYYMQPGDIYRNGKLSLMCLYPSASEVSTEDRNALSMILYLEYGSFQAVFTGDADEAGELRALEQLEQITTPEVCDLLKIAHHGSKSSSAEEFLQALKPGVAVISCGANNSYNHPATQTLSRLSNNGIPYLTTMEHGAITIWTDGEKYRVKTFR